MGALGKFKEEERGREREWQFQNGKPKVWNEMKWNVVVLWSSCHVCKWLVGGQGNNRWLQWFCSVLCYCGCTWGFVCFKWKSFCLDWRLPSRVKMRKECCCDNKNVYLLGRPTWHTWGDTVAHSSCTLVGWMAPPCLDDLLDRKRETWSRTADWCFSSATVDNYRKLMNGRVVAFFGGRVRAAFWGDIQQTGDAQ